MPLGTTAGGLGFMGAAGDDGAHNAVDEYLPTSAVTPRWPTHGNYGPRAAALPTRRVVRPRSTAAVVRGRLDGSRLFATPKSGAFPKAESRSPSPKSGDNKRLSISNRNRYDDSMRLLSQE
eukprot:Selendium_serpulae@DN3197_c1_g1_i1.p1